MNLSKIAYQLNDIRFQLNDGEHGEIQAELCDIIAEIRQFGDLAIETESATKLPREEAIAILSDLNETRYGNQLESLHMAIEALKQPSINEVIDMMETEVENNAEENEHGDSVVLETRVHKILQKYRKGISK